MHFSTSDSEAEGEAFVRPVAVRGEADLDIMRVGEEGRRGRIVATERPQSYRRSLNLKNKNVEGLSKYISRFVFLDSTPPHEFTLACCTIHEMERNFSLFHSLFVFFKKGRTLVTGKYTVKVHG